MKDLKERTIPITFNDFVCYLLLVIVGLSIIHLTLIATGYIIWNEENVFVSAFSFSGLLLGGIFGMMFWTEKWDLNPIHAIGYCLRWKK